ncbi:hypothetical protein BH09ACT7_BH09ACT7_13610 [soil metagenome]
MTSTLTPVSPDAPAANWLLPTRGEACVRLDKVVSRANAADGQRSRPLRALGTVARRVLVEQVEATLRSVMNDTLADVIVGGWRAYGAIAQAIRKSRSQPGVDQIVPLRNHTIKTVRQHGIDIEVDGLPVTTLSVELDIDVQLFDAVAVVRDGHLAAVRSGQATAAARVTVEGVDIAHRTLTFPLTAQLVLQGASADRTGTNTSPDHRPYRSG